MSNLNPTFSKLSHVLKEMLGVLISHSLNGTFFLSNNLDILNVCVCVFLGPPHLWHTEVPRQGVKLEL